MGELIYNSWVRKLPTYTQDQAATRKKVNKFDHIKVKKKNNCAAKSK